MVLFDCIGRVLKSNFKAFCCFWFYQVILGCTGDCNEQLMDNPLLLLRPISQNDSQLFLATKQKKLRILVEEGMLVWFLVCEAFLIGDFF